MAILDDHGRLFGRMNLIDVGAALFVIALVPLGYASWALFRLPPPVVESINPAVISAGQAGQHIEVRGRNLRPYLRAWVGTVKAAYLFESPDRAQVQVPALAPGTYDVALFDSKELARFPNAVTVPPAPPEKPVEIQFQVRFVARPEILDEVKRSQAAHAGEERHPTASHPLLLSCEVIDRISGTSNSELIQGPLNVVKCVVRVLAARTPNGWQYEGRPIKAGTSFMLTDEAYVLAGDILKVEVPDAAR